MRRQAGGKPRPLRPLTSYTRKSPLTGRAQRTRAPCRFAVAPRPCLVGGGATQPSRLAPLWNPPPKPPAQAVSALRAARPPAAPAYGVRAAQRARGPLGALTARRALAWASKRAPLARSRPARSAAGHSGRDS
jgi:hypothetical protein